MEIIKFFNILWPDPLDGYLAISTRRKGTKHLRTQFFPFPLDGKIDNYISMLRNCDTWFCLGILGSKLEHGRRGKEADVIAIPGLVCDLDCAEGQHKETNLPTRKEAMNFLNELPYRPTVLVWTGGGLHAYWLFDTPYMCETGEKRQKVKILSNAWQFFVKEKAQANGWKFDNVGSLEHLFRVPGTFNHKADPQLVEVIEENDFRYSPETFSEFLEDIGIEAPQGSAQGENGGIPERIQRIIEKCDFLRHCRDNASTLPEPEWWCMVCALVFEGGSREAIHQLSRPYPSYTPQETDKKILEALKQKGPMTCQAIQEKTGFQCPVGGCGVKTPVQLVHKRGADNQQNSGDEATLNRLARLPLIEYDRIREKEAKRLGIRVSTLDQLVQARRPNQPENGKPVIFEDLEPWPEPVDGPSLLDEIRNTIQRHVVLTPAQAVACTLWTIQTYCLDYFSVAPILALTSPEKRCGKTTLLTFLNGLVYKPLLASNITPAALFRVIQRYNPCLLIDEADTFIKDNDELRGVINSGHTKQTAFVIRVNTETLEPERFSTWGAKAIALIGRMPSTLQDRSVEIRLQRKLPGEKVEKIPLDFVEHMEPLRRKTLRWVMDNTDAIKKARPDVPDVGNDRAMDNWKPLFTIAEVAGEDWPELTREAMLAIEATADNENIRQGLLQDIQEIFTNTGTGKISSKDLVGHLIELEDRPWGEWRHGKPLTTNGLAKLLKPFGISSKTVRMGEKTAKGYEIAQFEEAFSRYLPQTPPIQNVTTSQSNKINKLGQNQNVTNDSNVTFSNEANLLKSQRCYVVTFQKQGDGGEYKEEGIPTDHEQSGFWEGEL